MIKYTKTLPPSSLWFFLFQIDQNKENYNEPEDNPIREVLNFKVSPKKHRPRVKLQWLSKTAQT